MKRQDPITHLLMRADNLAIALATKRKLAQEDKQLSEPVAQMLQVPKNREIAQAISQRVKLIKNILLIEFGTELHSQLGEKLKSENLHTHWRQGKDQKDWTNAYASSSFLPIRDSELKDVPYLCPIIQRTDDFVNFGITRSEDKKTRPSHWLLEPVKKLETHLKKNGYKTHLWWLGYKHLYDLREDDLYLALAGSMDEKVKEAADKTWNLFVETREMMEEANQALAKHTVNN